LRVGLRVVEQLLAVAVAAAQVRWEPMALA
jgi:hypothetical protein